MAFELVKDHGRWAVFGTQCRCLFFAGKGKKFCANKVKELNEKL